MSKHTWVRIEAVNLDHFVYDTNNLSTIRGSGIRLLEWPKLFDSESTEPNGFDWSRWPGERSAVSRGASALVLHIQKEHPIRDLCGAIDQYLRTHPVHRHATFVVDAVHADVDDAQGEVASFGAVYQRLLALNRKRQMGSLDLPLPARREEARSFCDVDRLRPGIVDPYVRDPAIKRVCESVAARLQYGRDTKRDWELIVGRESLPPRFKPVDDFEELTTRTTDAPDPLNRKMAVIYADGNGFGKKLGSAARVGEEQLCKWDAYLTTQRRALLIELAREIEPDEQWHAHVDRGGQQVLRHRIELLLWGGDEHIWVVPAWKAWSTLSFFFRQTEGWRFDKENLTHAVGVVFCHHNAPIRGVVQLAHRLAESAKLARRDESAFAYQVLESFDHLGDDFDRARKLQRPADTSERDMVLPPAALTRLPAWKQSAGSHGVTQGRRHQIAAALFRGDFAAYEALIHRIEEVNGAQRADTFPYGTLPRTALGLLRVSGSHRDQAAVAGPDLLLALTQSSDADATKIRTRLHDLAAAAETFAAKPLPPQREPFWTSEVAAWIHLIELWDYLPHERAPGALGGAVPRSTPAEPGVAND